jgi:hypothetical protein
MPNFNHSDYGYGTVGVIGPGDVDLVTGIGPYRPEQGCVWLKDQNDSYWEASEDDLQRSLEKEGV